MGSQSPKEEFDRFTRAMTKMGYWFSKGDHTLFNKHSIEGKVTSLLVYDDDIIVT